MIRKIGILFIALSFGLPQLNAQELTGSQLLDKAIAYHDPDNQWPSFSGELKLLFTGPAMADSERLITLDLPNQYFNMSIFQDGQTTMGQIDGQACRLTADDGAVVETTIEDEACQRTLMYRDYYTYLYGLPMKLRDPGTKVDPKVERVTFKTKPYLKLKVTYDTAVGSDIWYFYFNPKTYAMEVYQFYKPNDPKSGEYILLTGEVVVSGIKMPKDRAWYYNKDDGFLGTDILLDK